MKVMARTVAEIIIPGGIQNHGAMVMTLMLCASLSMFPSSARGPGRRDRGSSGLLVEDRVCHPEGRCHHDVRDDVGEEVANHDRPVAHAHHPRGGDVLALPETEDLAAHKAGDRAAS